MVPVVRLAIRELVSVSSEPGFHQNLRQISWYEMSQHALDLQLEVLPNTPLHFEGCWKRTALQMCLRLQPCQSITRKPSALAIEVSRRSI